MWLSCFDKAQARAVLPQLVRARYFTRPRGPARACELPAWARTAKPMCCQDRAGCRVKIARRRIGRCWALGLRCKYQHGHHAAPRARCPSTRRAAWLGRRSTKSISSMAQALQPNSANTAARAKSALRCWTELKGLSVRPRRREAGVVLDIRLLLRELMCCEKHEIQAVVTCPSRRPFR